MKPQEHKYASQVAYTRALEAYYAEQDARIDSLLETIKEMATIDNPLIVEMTQQAIEAEARIQELEQRLVETQALGAWISVDDRLPSLHNGYSDRVLTVDTRDRVVVMRFDGYAKYWETFESLGEHEVTHWMSLPHHQ
jgi:hypothetical protein